MERGQYFGEIELLTDRQNIATIRASLDTGVEVAALDREAFKELVGQAPQVREQIERTAQERQQENISARQKERGNG
jgi:CRP-like cAMP-binding protein